jgi:hypothetical protein
MKSSLAAGTILTLLFWSLLSVSLFAAPTIVSNRATEVRSTEVAAEVQDLIRQHQEATSPMRALPPQAGGECLALPGEDSVAGQGPAEEGAAFQEASPDAPIIRPVGQRPRRIQV